MSWCAAGITQTHRVSIGALVMGALLLGAPREARAQWQYSELPPLPHFTTTPSAIAFDVNDLGQAVGQAAVVTGGNRAVFHSHATGTLDLGTLPTTGPATSVARAINNAGVVVGRSSVGDGTAFHAFSWTASGGMIDLGVLGGVTTQSAIGLGVNESGSVVGASTVNSGGVHAFRKTPSGVMEDLGTLGGQESSAADINDAGVIVGVSQNAAGLARAFIWTEAAGMVEIENTLGGNESEALGINNHGVVVGRARNADGVPHAFRWTATGGMIDLGSFGGPLAESAATAINDSGRIVGFSFTAGPPAVQRPFHWTPGVGMVDIAEASLPLTPGRAEGINNAGHVVGAFSIPAGNVPVLWHAPQDDLAIDFGPAFGLWQRRGTVWSQLHTLSPEGLRRGDIDSDLIDEMLVDFGPGIGLWAWVAEDEFWLQLHGFSPTSMVFADIDPTPEPVNNENLREIIVDFPGHGLWQWKVVITNDELDVAAGWSQLHTLDVSHLISANLDGAGTEELIADFPGFGLWKYADGAWSQLHTLDVTTMITTDLDGNGHADLVVNFPVHGIWVYLNDSTWEQLHTVQPARLAAGDLDANGDADLVVDFGATFGIWVLMNRTDWIQLHGFTSHAIVVADLDGNGRAQVVVDFGAPGVWEYEDGAGWSQLHFLPTEIMTAGRIH
jgi:probable HAF family extracellular repeat protein